MPSGSQEPLKNKYPEIDEIFLEIQSKEKTVSNAINIELRANDASCAAKDNIVPSMGPIHGVHPKANASPSMYAPKALPPRSPASTLTSIYKNGIFNTPIKCKPNKIMTAPATRLNQS